LQLAFYLSAKGSTATHELVQVLRTLNEMPLKPEQRIATAEIALRSGQASLAQKQASKALESKETRTAAFQILADVAWHQQNWAEFEKRSGDLEKLYLQVGERGKAAEYALNSAIRLAPVKTKGETKKRLLKVLNDHPDYAPAYDQLANFSQSESNEIALYYMKKAVQLAPERPEYKDRLALHYLNQSRITEAEAIYNELIQSDQGATIGYIGLSRCSLKRNDPLMAIVILEDGMQKSGKSPELYLELGRISDSIRDYKRAAEAYREFINLSPENIEGYILAAEAYRKEGNHAAAQDLYREVLKRDPENPHASESLSRLN
jgi:tetratricopeptide (TPR) repeat protein